MSKHAFTQSCSGVQTSANIGIGHRSKFGDLTREPGLQVSVDSIQDPLAVVQ